MNNLSDFLLARIAEDEQYARIVLDDDRGAARVPLPGGRTRVLAECEAKRMLIEGRGHARVPRSDVQEPLSWEDLPGGWTRVQLGSPGRVEDMLRSEFIERFTEPAAPSRELRILAVPYADHPDYRSEWKP